MAELVPRLEVVKAAVESTEKYYDFLCKTKRGVEKLPATKICASTHEPYLLENAVWHKHRCQLPQHQTIPPDSSATLIPHTSPATESHIWILEYDRRTGNTNFSAQKPVDSQTGDVIIDFRWLVKRCLDWLKGNGNRLCSITELPASSLSTSTSRNIDDKTSEDQLEAFKVALTAPLSYIWGPPGTGKTKFVLAPAARHCVDQHQRVLIVASTNLSVDNALSAVLKDGVDRTKVARIGVPSPGFLKEFPECCEQRAFEPEIKQINSQIQTLEDEKQRVERARQLDDQVRSLQSEVDGTPCDLAKHRMALLDVEKRLSQKLARLAELERKCESRDGDYQEKSKSLSEKQTLESAQIQSIRKCEELQRQITSLGLFARSFTRRKSKLMQTLSSEREHLCSVETTLQSKRNKDDVDAGDVERLQRELTGLRGELEDLCNELSELDAAQQKLQSEISSSERLLHRLETELRRATEERSRIGGSQQTGQYDERIAALQEECDDLQARLQQFKQDLAQKSVLGMTLDGFIGLTLETGLSIHRVFVDEAPYAPLAKVLPLLSLHCPIAMFGDHFQLPPICECENDPIIQAFWAKPSIFLDDAFRFGTDLVGLNKHERPTFCLTRKRDLKVSYRFAPWLADLLDRYVYERCGFTGSPDCATSIECIHCKPHDFPERERRQNPGEVDAVCDFVGRHIEQWKRDGVTAVVLTPYKPQVKMIRKKLGSALDWVEVLNTHKTQGREWDWVLFSVSDTGRLKGNQPFFTDSNSAKGKPVLNTSISRAKFHLVVFLDCSSWKRNRPDSLLSAIAARSCGYSLDEW